MSKEKPLIPEFGIISSLILMALNGLNNRYERKGNMRKAAFCRQGMIIHMGYYLPKISAPLHFIRKIFFFITILRIIGIMPAFFGFKWIDKLRVYMSNKIEFLLKNIHATLPVKKFI